MELELALPFLSATHDLPRFAVVSKACRDAARESYLKRVKESRFPISDNMPIVEQQPKVVMEDRSDVFKPWWLVQERKLPFQPLTGPYPLVFCDDGSWKLGRELPFGTSPPPMPTAQKLTFDAEHRELFQNQCQNEEEEDDEEEDGNDLTYVEHLSLVNHSLLVILCKWTGRGYDYYHNPDTRRQLFAVVYDVSNSINSSSCLLLPTMCCPLTEPLNSFHSGQLNRISFGNAWRSRNGKVVAVVTALPLGNEDNFRDQDDVRQTAEVTVFDIPEKNIINNKSLEKRCSMEIPMGHRTIGSSLTMTISNAGELLSIYTDTDHDQEYRNWRVYDIRSRGGQATVIAKKDEAVQHLISHHFTPDNELWVVLSDFEEDEEEATEEDTFFHDVRMPSWLAKRMVVLVKTVTDDNSLMD